MFLEQFCVLANIILLFLFTNSVEGFNTAVENSMSSFMVQNRIILTGIPFGFICVYWYLLYYFAGHLTEQITHTALPWATGPLPTRRRWAPPTWPAGPSTVTGWWPKTLLYLRASSCPPTTNSTWNSGERKGGWWMVSYNYLLYMQKTS